MFHGICTTPTRPIPRTEIVRSLAAVSVSGWGDDDNKRVIPTIPGPRRSPDGRPTTPAPAPRPNTGEAGR